MRKSALRNLALVAGLAGRVLRAGRPPPVSTAQRIASLPLAGYPLDKPVEIAWDAHQIPSITARSDRDLAVALGAVHAHLRLAQMEAMRRLATGRIAEVVGPAAIEIDRALRLFGFDAAVSVQNAVLPEATRRWADGFLAGVNHHLASSAILPYELRLLDVRPEPWTLELHPPSQERSVLGSI